MEIINRTCIPTQILESLIEDGLKTAKCLNTNFKIQFNPGKYLRGVAYRLNTSCKVVIPISRNGISYIWKEDENLGKLIYQVIVHELTHVADYQKGIHMGTYYQRKGTKPCEVRAIAAEELAVKNMPDELLDNLEFFLDMKRNSIEVGNE
jgi:hypothetical protein